MKTEKTALETITSMLGNIKVIGTDGSLEVCIGEGYLMMKEIELTCNIDYLHFFAFIPNYVLTENGKTEPELMTNVEMSLNYLLEKYNVHKKGIDNFADCNYSLNPKKYKNCQTILRLADVVNVYCGLD